MTLLHHTSAAGLDCLLIGGHAVILCGVPRSTFDLDLLVRAAQREEWRGVLIGLGYTVFHETEVFQQWTPPGVEVAVDLMLVDEETWRKMAGQSDERELGTVRCRVVAPLHLIALKLHAMKFRPGEAAEKDWHDVVGLIRSCGIAPTSAELWNILHRYANAETILRFEQHYDHHA